MGLKGRTTTNSEVSDAWDREYALRRYTDEPPVGFVADILAAARDAGIIGKVGLYMGCGNGRNYLPLVRGGLDLIGLDISRTALDQLGQRAPDRRGRLVAGDLSALTTEGCYPMVIGNHADFHAVLPLRRQVTHRTSLGTDQWSQWEGIWRRTR